LLFHICLHLEVLQALKVSFHLHKVDVIVVRSRKNYPLVKGGKARLRTSVLPSYFLHTCIVLRSIEVSLFPPCP
jgi:hypothetical protein